MPDSSEPTVVGTDDACGVPPHQPGHGMSAPPTEWRARDVRQNRRAGGDDAGVGVGIPRRRWRQRRHRGLRVVRRVIKEIYSPSPPGNAAATKPRAISPLREDKSVVRPGNKGQAGVKDSDQSAFVYHLFGLATAAGCFHQLIEEAQRRVIITDDGLNNHVRSIVRDEVARSGETGMSRGRYLTVKEAAGHTGVAEVTIRDWAKKGMLKAARAGSRWRIKLADLENTIRQKREVAVDLDAEAARIVSLEQRRRGKHG